MTQPGSNAGGRTGDQKIFRTLRAMATRTTAPMLILVLMALVLPAPLQARSHFPKRDQGAMQDQETKLDRGGEMIRPSGLQPVFPGEARCPEIASPFGAQTRYDGSPRPTWSFGGYHGGIDISLVDGTPLLALAAGMVVSKGEGGRMEGIYLWLRHSPEDTGLGYWVYSKYQHLQSLPELAMGARVAMAEVVGRSGRTGTTGGHYGTSGYPHLHLTTLKSATGDQTVGSRGATRGGTLIDPLVIYHEAGVKPQESADRPLYEKTVRIPYSTTEGQVWPPGTRVVWPVACQPK